MVFCKACDKYLELLHGLLHPVQSEQDNEQVMKELELYVESPEYVWNMLNNENNGNMESWIKE